MCLTTSDVTVTDFVSAMPFVRARQVAAVTVSNALEFNDFPTYSFFAAQIGRTFFPSAAPPTSLLASLATFGAGLQMRPLGALVIGRVGDRAGRKSAVLLTFTLALDHPAGGDGSRLLADVALSDGDRSGRVHGRTRDLRHSRHLIGSGVGDRVPARGIRCGALGLIDAAKSSA